MIRLFHGRERTQVGRRGKNALYVADKAMIEDACIHREARR